MDKKQELLKIFSKNLRQLIDGLQLDFEKLQEIHLRVNRPLLVIYNNREYLINQTGCLTGDANEAYEVSHREIQETLEYISNYSLYAYENEIRQGFITIQGGHRVGLAGKIILENERIKGIRYISFINIRLSHQVKGCANGVMPFICSGEGGKRVYHTLIVSPPRCGKTTLLRDIIRQLSDGSKKCPGVGVGVVDERSEIGACYMGVPQNELGIRTDILDCCPKAVGMLMLLRSMAPEVIAVDEIGSREDIEAIAYVINCGCKLIATVHGNSIDDIKTKPVLRRLVEEKIFERYIILSNRETTGRVEAIFDAYGSDVLKGYGCVNGC